jgi:hypothetical protein
MITVSVDKLIAALKKKGYKVAEDDTKNYNLNIVGIRNSTQVPNSFDDTIVMFWKFQGKWNIRTFPCTTEPGNYWLLNPSNVLGTGILKEGQYIDTWEIALHQGKYEALCQRKPVTAIRDFDKDAQLDFNAPDLTTLKKTTTKTATETIDKWTDAAGKVMWIEATGLYGINIHRANENGKSVLVDKWSAACQVLQNRQIFHPDNQTVKVYEFDYFLHLAKQRAVNFGPKFTYTLIRDKDIA